VHTLRGVSAEWLFCDETAFMNQAVYHEIVIPLFEMRNACLICISSPLGQFNFYSALIALRDPRTGLSIIDSYHLKLVCDRCMKKEHPEYCTHERDKIPPWKSSDKLDIVKLIMEVCRLFFFISRIVYKDRGKEKRIECNDSSMQRVSGYTRKVYSYRTRHFTTAVEDT